MTHEELVEKVARAIADEFMAPCSGRPFDWHDEALAAIAVVKEECAAIADAECAPSEDPESIATAQNIAAAIRKLGETK